MGVEFRNITEELLYRQDESMDMKRLMANGDVREQLPFWDVLYRQHYYEGIHIGQCRIDVHEDLMVSSSQDAPVPSLVFIEEGEILTNSSDQKKSRHFSAGDHNILTNPFHARLSYFRKQRVQVMVLSFQPERFLQLAENGGPAMDRIAEKLVQGGEPYISEKCLRVTPRMRAVMEDIHQCPYSGALRDVYLQAKALELLVLQFEQLEQAENTCKPPARLSAADIKKLHHAREILLQDFCNPPSLPQLARLTGLNEFKLKTGFKEVFNNTVFGYFKNHRLALAHQLLTSASKTVTEVAYETGYTTVQHFSNEFRKQYGVTPSRIR
ncbi:helix-turn-helix transcriptional regulator [Chitinophaga sp. Mgbs1]|uniref:Helix-turn-helix transcriptional regulator n=1 Tax=Chitinophaga solisilvae TaxID=1233460 RepID=A0A3S1CV62_9BACT|nr:helix-turn-helix transcriptional regulator [Chitinophaga solisilvae]